MGLRFVEVDLVAIGSVNLLAEFPSYAAKLANFFTRFQVPQVIIDLKIIFPQVHILAAVTQSGGLGRLRHGL